MHGIKVVPPSSLKLLQITRLKHCFICSGPVSKRFPPPSDLWAIENPWLQITATKQHGKWKSHLSGEGHMDMMERYGEDHRSTINPPVRVCASTCECFDPPPEPVELCAGIVDTHIFIYSQYVINASCICQTTGSSTQSMYHTTKHKVAKYVLQWSRQTTTSFWGLVGDGKSRHRHPSAVVWLWSCVHLHLPKEQGTKLKFQIVFLI